MLDAKLHGEAGPRKWPSRAWIPDVGIYCDGSENGRGTRTRTREAAQNTPGPSCQARFFCIRHVLQYPYERASIQSPQTKYARTGNEKTQNTEDHRRTRVVKSDGLRRDKTKIVGTHVRIEIEFESGDRSSRAHDRVDGVGNFFKNLKARRREVANTEIELQRRIEKFAKIGRQYAFNGDACVSAGQIIGQAVDQVCSASNREKIAATSKAGIGHNPSHV